MLSSGLILRERYRIVCQIGNGGTSSVYLAEDVSIGKKWAVKFLPCDDDTFWLAQNEINMMIMLDYEMFPRIVDAWQEPEGYFIVSDYIEGITLDRVIGRKQISKRTLTGWWLDIANAIKYLHDHKPSILYLDLKLENIMLKRDGSLKLIDFGIAGRIAQRGSLYGTPGYAAPEQYYNCGELLDERTDIFAFGMLMYAMFTGRKPVRELKEQERIIRHCNGLPSRIRSMILNCINEDKDKRYGSMNELIGELISLRGSGNGVMRIKLAVAAVLAVIFIMIFGATAVRYVVAEPVDNAAERMIAEANEHICDGEYTDEGIRIICGYIEAGCLDSETCGRFTYEVARNYFAVKRNYREAFRYFEMLDQQVYPEVSYYMELCSLQMSFEEDKDRYIKCLTQFGEYNRTGGYGETRYENDFMIANLYEGLKSMEGYNVQPEINCLKEGLCDLRYAVEAGLFTDEDAKYEAEYCRRLCILYEGTGDVENAISFGQQALKLLSNEREAAVDDIRNRLDSLKASDNNL
ncbi:MAG: serine/threonine protein kinase [Lachnospiraceae bacterium]|nr:serine/threonine protein kinase [Lachnospiraceae bacterium]